MRLVSLFLLILQISHVYSYTYYWTDWTNGKVLKTTEPKGYNANGTINTATTKVDVTFTSTGNIFGMQYGSVSDIDYFEPNATSTTFPSIPGTANVYTSAQVTNRPTTKDIIQLYSKTTVTLSFSKPVVDPVLALLSTNGNTYEFTSTFKILSQSGTTVNGKLYNNGFFGNGVWSTSFNDTTAKYKLITANNEAHGSIQLVGTFSSITWTTSIQEKWHGFTVGVRATQDEALVGTGVGPAQGVSRCTSVGDPHVISFQDKKFDCHVAGARTYYTTTSGSVTTSVDTNHTAVPSKPKIMVNNEVYIFVSGIGSIKADASGNITFTNTTGYIKDFTLQPTAYSNQWGNIANGLYFIRTPGGVAKKYGVYVSNAQLTVYFQRASWANIFFWNVEIIAVRLASDRGLCVDESCKSTPPTPDACPNNTPNATSIAAACAAAVGSSTDPLYTFCVADVSNACDLSVALTFDMPDSPPAPLTPNSPVVGDPQFSGLQGQNYQVHGADDTVFALISTPKFQMNGLFTFLGVGDDCKYNHTQCWSHPGTYISELGFLIRHHNGSESKLHIVSGTYLQGLHILLDGEQHAVDTQGSFYVGTQVKVSIKSKFKIRVHIHDLFVIEVTNAHHFFNMGVQLLRRDWLAAGAKHVDLTTNTTPHALDVYPKIELHGLLGCTWRYVTYPHKRVYEGDVMDYAIDNPNRKQRMFDTDFTYTEYILPEDDTSGEADE